MKKLTKTTHKTSVKYINTNFRQNHYVYIPVDGVNSKCADFNDIKLLLFIFRTKFPIRRTNYGKCFH